MTQERTPVSTEALAAAWVTWHERHGGKLGPGPAFAEALAAGMAAGMAVDLAAAREAGRLEGDAAGYRRGMEEAIRIIDALPRGLEPDWTGTTRDMSPRYLPARVRIPTVDEGVSAIRAKMEGK